MSAPPVPPRPYELSPGHERNPGAPPPLPPLPADLRIKAEKYVTPSRYELETPAHLLHKPHHVPVPPPPPLSFQQQQQPPQQAMTPIPLIAPRPTKMDKSVPVNMARRLDEQMEQQQLQQQLLQQQQYQQQQQQQRNQVNFSPGFLVPSAQGGWQAPAPPIAGSVDLATSIANLSIQPSAPFQPQQSLPYPPNMAASAQQPAIAQSSSSSSSSQPSTSSSSATSLSSSSSSSTGGGAPSLTAPLPSLAQLSAASAQVQQPSHDPALRIAWARDVFLLLDRAQGSPTDPPIGPIHIPDPTLSALAASAMPLVLQIAGSWSPSQGGKMPVHVAEAIYWRAMAASTGAFPEWVRHNPRTAFRDFEAAARGGYAPAWFRLGRDYENFNDHTRAKECFERGAKLNVESCLYRLGMAHLLGQLSLPANASTALPYLHRAALLASLTCPQPAYVFSLLLLSEFTSIPPLAPSLLAPFIPPSSSPTIEARKHLERAAYLHFPAAQYKLGHAYEFAEPPFPFDPLLSVQYYSLASQQGEVEADMALSKWFLCGSGGAALSSGSGSSAGGFEKDEALALTFAEKAAKKGLPSAEFAMGYYAEVGVGQQRDIPRALEWYRLAESHGNEDATARLQALSSSSSSSSSANQSNPSNPSPPTQALSREDHETLTEARLIRKRTLAAQRAENEPLSPPWEGRVFPSARVWEEGGGAGGGAGAGAGGAGAGEGNERVQGQYGQLQQVQGQTGGQGQGQLAGGGRNQRQDPRMVVDVIRKNSLATGYAPVSVIQGQGQGQAQAQAQSFGGRRGESPQRMGTGMAGGLGAGGRGESPQRIAPGGRARYDSSPSSRMGGGAITPPNQYGQQGKRTQSPGRLGGRLPISGSPSGSNSNSSLSSMGGGGGGGGGGRSGSPGSVTALPLSSSPGTIQGQGVGKSKLERMRLNLDDPSPNVPVPPSSSSSSIPTSTSTSTTPLINTSVPLTTPGAGLGAGATPTTARPGHTPKPQTFADMGIVGGKAEDKECVVM